MVSGQRTRPPQFLRRVHNRPALRRKSSLAVFAQLMLVVSGLALGGAIAYAGHAYVAHNNTFRLRRLVLESVPAELESLIRSRLAIAHNANLLTIAREPLHTRLQTIPQVRRAYLRRLLPDAVAVEVELRVPWAIVGALDGQYLVSADGVVLTPTSEAAGALADLRIDVEIAPALDATRRLPTTLPGVAAFEPATRIVEWLDRVQPGAFGTVAHYLLRPEGVVVVPSDAPWRILLGDATDLAAKAENFRALLHNAPPEPGSLVDLRYQDMVVVRDPEELAVSGQGE